MATIWLGDFRAKQLQQYFIKTDNESRKDTYLVDDYAEYSWFSTNASAHLPLFYESKADVIITLGFNDCVQSCTWPVFNIEDIVEKYMKTVNSFIELYTDLNFYFCSICPIDGDYPFSNYESTGVIPKEDLDNKIKQFNKKLKAECLKAESKVTFIDSYDYLTSTSFTTRDGIRYTVDTCENLYDFIRSKIKVEIQTSTFLGRIRATEDDAPKKSDDDTYIYWTHTSKSGGLNECVEIISGSGDVLPNCVGYAWGRFYEIIGEIPKLFKGNAGNWYGYNDGYERNSRIDEFPRVGSVICWSKPGEAGHVGIVESIDTKTGTIITSESGYNDKAYDPTDVFWVTTRIYDSSKQNWRKAENGKAVKSWIDDYVFQGFIYPPQTSASKTDLCTKNSYGISLEEMKPNARYIWQYLGSRGWTLNAVAALLGNMQQESKLSPGVWENVVTDCETIDATTGVHTLTTKGKQFSDGYGLTQWTPATKFFTWCNNGGAKGNANGSGGVLPYWEIDTQLMRIEAEVAASTGSWIEGLSQWIKKASKGYDMTFSEFITSDKDAAWLAGAFAFCYERPARSTGSLAEQDALKEERGGYGKYWYDYLNSLSPIVTEDTTLKVSSFKLDGCKTSQINFSFLASNAESAEYTLTQGNNKIISKKIAEFATDLNKIVIKSDKIIPNKSYKLELKVHGANDKSFSKKITCEVPQELPESIKSIKLSCKDTLKSTKSKFKLTINKPDNLGYWKKNSFGYDLQLFINGKCIKTKVINEVKNISSDNFSIKKEFGYDCKLGDIVQIGVRVWTKDSDSNKIYDGLAPKTSNAICLLNRPVTAYLNN